MRPCDITDCPGVSFGAVDRDNLTLWMDAVDERGTTPAIIWSSCGSRSRTSLARESRFSLSLPLGVCTPPTPVSLALE